MSSVHPLHSAPRSSPAPGGRVAVFPVRSGCFPRGGPIWNRPLQQCGRGCGQGRRLWRGGGCGTMQASSPTRVCDAARLRFSGWLRAPSGLQGTISTVPQGLAPRQPGRYGIGPYGGAGGVAAMRRRARRGGVCGGMRASRPTDVLWVLQAGDAARFRHRKPL